VDFSFTKEQAELREAARLLGLTLNEGLRKRDRDEVFDQDGWKKLAELGIHGLPLPQAFGGMGCDALTTVGVLESLGQGCRDNGLLFSINAQLWTAALPILWFGSEAQKAKWLPGLCSGARIGGNAMSEPESGSDAYSLRTRAVRRGDRYLLNGSKIFVTNGPVADVIVVYATLDPKLGARGISGFLVERGARGFRVGRPLEKMGLRTSPMAELFFDDCEVPAENLLGKEGGGTNLFNQSLTWERACILANGVGAMQRLYDQCLAYARTRRQFGEPIGKFQMVASRLIDMRMRLESARAALYRTAWLRDQGKSVFLEAAMTKLQISEAWVATAQDAVQIHGGYGYMSELELERELRDAIGSRLYSGTSEIQRLIIAPLLGL
jgi:alkylation response protein AidB-like acyl-CoA dehydrogenase